MNKYIIHGRMSVDHDWHHITVCREDMLKRKISYYSKTWRYLYWELITVKIGSPEHKAYQEESGKELKKRLEAQVKSGPKSNGMFDQLSHSFASNLLNGLNSRKVVKK